MGGTVLVTIYPDEWTIKVYISLNPWMTYTNNKITEHVNNIFVVMAAGRNRNDCRVEWIKQ
jgi:hypothetical protein